MKLRRHRSSAVRLRRRHSQQCRAGAGPESHVAELFQSCARVLADSQAAVKFMDGVDDLEAPPRW
jgi:hypothetical protein